MTAIVPVSIADLIEPETPEDALQKELTACIEFGLQTTAWEPVSFVPAILNVNAQLAADNSQDVANLAQGAYASLAAQMVDGNGNPITTWMQLRATDQYNITPQPATYASGPVPYTNTSSTSYPYSPNNPLRAQNPATGATYASTATGSLAPGSSTVNLQADAPGAASTSAAGVTLTLITPFNGVSLGVLATSLVGTNQESNQALLLRGQNKLATLAPIQSTDIPGPVAGGATGAFQYVAKSIPQASSSSGVIPFTVTSTITGCVSFVNPSSGVTTVVIRNSAGAPSTPDIAAVQNAMYQYCVFDGLQIEVVGVNNISVLVTGTIYISRNSPVSAVNANINALDALANYFASIPIGGVSTSGANILPIDKVIATVIGANAGTTDFAITSPAASVSLGMTGAPVVNPSSFFNVVYV
jgi:hypothetical protein